MGQVRLRYESSPDVEVELTWRELHQTGFNAVFRSIRHIAKKSKSKWGQDCSKLTIHDDWLGAIGELAVAKHLDRYWAGIDYGAVDASVVDVRSVDVEGHRMMLHPEDRDDLPVVLVLVERELLPVVRLMGWIIGRDGKLREYWQDPTGKDRFAFFVPNSKLHAMSELRR